MSAQQPETTERAPSDPARWRALLFIALAQLMVVLDSTIVNIALPSMQESLHISDADRQWVVTAYALAFGGLLLLGGRIGDHWGRKKAFLTGLLGFAAASALGGAAQNTTVMLGARALQGAFGALLAPAALSLLAVTFTDHKERAKAFGVFGAVSGGGAAVGLVLGGLLTEYLDWRWTFFINVPTAALAALGAWKTVHTRRRAHTAASLDTTGAVVATLGLVALVHGFSSAETNGWTARITVASLALAVVLLIAFAVVETRHRNPLLPPRVVWDRTRGGVYLALGLATIGMFGLFLFMTYYLQTVRGYSPVLSGLAFLPLVAGMMIGSTQIGARLMLRVPARVLMSLSLLATAAGIASLTAIGRDSSYAALILPGMTVVGLGLGTATMLAMALAPHGVEDEDAGVASAMINTSQQVGGAIGTALLSSIAAGAAHAYSTAHHGGAQNDLVLVHGYTTAFTWAAALVALAGVLSFAVLRPGRLHTG
ncbi:MFS transporter [Streptomyces shenzhenensis]|uniref:MFS transporter n=1 Tax=Streptomyces shenzhenensis TaxID=943815 RepID=UPI0036A826ED